jgi:hypothetical protein
MPMNIQVESIIPTEKHIGSFFGRVDVILPDLGVRVSGIRLYRNPERTWIHIPSIKDMDRKGVLRWIPNFSFVDTKIHQDFIDELLETILTHLQESEVADE